MIKPEFWHLIVGGTAISIMHQAKSLATDNQYRGKHWGLVAVIIAIDAIIGGLFCLSTFHGLEPIGAYFKVVIPLEAKLGLSGIMAYLSTLIVSAIRIKALGSGQENS